MTRERLPRGYSQLDLGLDKKRARMRQVASPVELGRKISPLVEEIPDETLLGDLYRWNPNTSYGRQVHVPKEWVVLFGSLNRVERTVLSSAIGHLERALISRQPEYVFSYKDPQLKKVTVGDVRSLSLDGLLDLDGIELNRAELIHEAFRRQGST